MHGYIQQMIEKNRSWIE